MENLSKNMREIFSQALEKEDPKERSEFLDDACGEDQKLREKVEALIALRSQVGNFLASPPFIDQPPLDDLPEESAGTVIGRYKLLEKIGEGGMAVVYMAEQEKPIRRKVALKIIKLGMDTKQVIARFEAERQALAMMDHPNIAKVIDAGATETGRPYFVMELVTGVSITEYCDKNNLSTKERLALFIQVCNAVQHAHQKGIIHRDIKPSNVMVTHHDGRPVPKIIDFGIAKAINQRLTEKTLFTRYAHIIGTPAYMSPEQAHLSDLDIDTRSDIYSLGVLLYELLTGTTPFSEEQLREAGYIEMQRIIREQEPTKPSTKLSTLGQTLTDIAKHRGCTPDLLTKSIRGDLDWIVMKSLEKDRNRRYETANDLGMDIKRHLGSEPVLAGAPMISYRLRKFIRRNRIIVTAGLLVAAALVTGSVTTSVMYFQAEKERKRTAEALRQSRYSLYVSNIRAAQNVIENPVSSAAAKYYLNRCPEEFRHWEWRRLNWLADRSFRTIHAYESVVSFVAFSPDGKHIFSIGHDALGAGRTIKVYSTDTGEELVTLSREKEIISREALSPDGRRIVAVSRTGLSIFRGQEPRLNFIKVFDVFNGKELMTTKGHEIDFNSVAYSPDGQWIVSGCRDGTIKVWNANTGEESKTLRSGHEGWISSVVFSPDGEWIASGSRDNTVKLWNANTGEELKTLIGHEGWISSVVFSPDGEQIVSGGRDNTVKLWNANTGEELMTLLGHEGEVASVAYSPDGSRIVSNSRDNTIKLWDAKTGAKLVTLRGHEGAISSVVFTPDGERIVSGSIDTTVRIWDATTGEELTTLLGYRGTALSVAFGPDGKYIVSGGVGGTIKMWDIETVEEPMILRGHEQSANSVAFSPDSKRIASGSRDKTIKVWDTDSGEELMTLRGDGGGVVSVDFSPDGKRIVSAGVKYITIFDAGSGKELKAFRAHKRALISVTFSPDGKRIVSCSDDNTIMVWDADSGKELRTLRGDESRVASVAFSPDGKRIVSGGSNSIRIWDAETGEELRNFGGHEGTVVSVAFSPDGKSIITGSGNSVRIWDAETGEELMNPMNEPRSRSVTLSPDGGRIISGGFIEITIWDAATGEELMNLGGHENFISDVAFSPNGKYIASVDDSNNIRIWSCGPH